jgi:hypothetical protein
MSSLNVAMIMLLIRRSEGHEKINLLAFKDQNIITGLEYYDKMR